MKHGGLLVYLLFMLLAGTRAQSPTAYSLHEYTTENGLPSNGIKGMVWDEKNGFLWLSTESGMVRFNGNDFVSFPRDSVAPATPERMFYMVRSYNGSIHATGAFKQLYTIQGNRPLVKKLPKLTWDQFYRLSPLVEVSDSFFTFIAEKFPDLKFPDNPQKIIPLSGSAGLVNMVNGLYRFSAERPQPEILPFVSTGGIKPFRLGNEVYYAEKEGAVFRLNPALDGQTLVTVETTEGRPLSLGKGVAIYSGNGLPQPLAKENGNIWRLSAQGNKIIAQLLYAALKTDALIRFMQYSEKTGTLFIGTDSRGLMVLMPAQVQVKKIKNATAGSRNSYYAQIELPNNAVLTNEGDVIGENGPVQNRFPIKGKFTFAVSRLPDSTLWYSQMNVAAGGSFLHRYDYKTGALKVFKSIRPGDHALVATSLNRTFIITDQGIGELLQDTLRFLQRLDVQGFSRLVFDVLEAEPGVLLLASCGGLYRFSVTTNKLDVLFSRPNTCVRSLWQYNGYIFFGTYGGGYYIMRNNRIKPMPLDKNKRLLYAHCFVADDEGFCWISTNRGLFRARLNDLTNAYDNDLPQVYYQYFGREDGMQITELNGGCKPCALKMQNGTLSFPTMDGLLWVEPGKIIDNTLSGPLFIDEMTADGKKINPDDANRISLPAGTREISLQLAFPAWGNSENLLVEYLLSGNEQWLPVEQYNGATLKLNNLPSGEYRLQLRKLNGFGVNNYVYKEITFTITTPWHKQGWFYVLLTLLALGAVLLFLKWRTRQYKIRQVKLEKQVQEKTRELQQQNQLLEKNNTIKTRLISIISHDIVTPLKFLTVAGKNLLDKKQLMSEALQEETIREITNTSQELQMLSTNILNWIKYQHENRQPAREQFNLHEAVNQVTGVLNSLARQKNIRLENAVDPALQIYQFLEPVKILVFNLVSNALHFSEQGTVTIGGAQPGSTITLSVKDNGMGMSPEQVRNILSEQVIISSANVDNRRGNGLGYLIIKDLVKITGATLDIKSKKGEGTEVFLRFPGSKTA